MDFDLCTVLPMFLLYLSLTVTCLDIGWIFELAGCILGLPLPLGILTMAYILFPYLSPILLTQCGMIRSFSPNCHTLVCFKVELSLNTSPKLTRNNASERPFHLTTDSFE